MGVLDFLRRDITPVWMRPKEAKRPQVSFDDVQIVVLDPDGVSHVLRWDAVARIAYETRKADPWADDYFLTFQDRAGSFFRVSFDWPGSRELSERVDQLPGVTYGPQGKLVNRIEPASVVIWPSTEAGHPLVF